MEDRSLHPLRFMQWHFTGKNFLPRARTPWPGGLPTAQRASRPASVIGAEVGIGVATASPVGISRATARASAFTTNGTSGPVSRPYANAADERSRSATAGRKVQSIAIP